MATRFRADDDRLVEQVARICARAQEPLALLERVARAVRNHVPYDTAGWLLVDPDTLLINGVYEEDVPREAHLSLMELELGTDDPNKFVDLGRAREPTAALSATTEGRLDRCTRWRSIYDPMGFGDELRTVFRTGSVMWGHACLTRRADEPWFSRREVDVVARLSPHVAHGIRTGLLLHESWADGHGQSPGLVVLEPSSRSDVAPVLMHLHELTPREREVTQLLLTGMATADIAQELWITPDTLRGHVKSVFAKLGVCSRPELFARLAHEPRVRSAATG